MISISIYRNSVPSISRDGLLYHYVPDCYRLQPKVVYARQGHEQLCMVVKVCSLLDNTEILDLLVNLGFCALFGSQSQSLVQQYCARQLSSQRLVWLLAVNLLCIIQQGWKLFFVYIICIDFFSCIFYRIFTIFSTPVTLLVRIVCVGCCYNYCKQKTNGREYSCLSNW